MKDYRMDTTVNELLRAKEGELKRIPNPSNPKLYSIVWVQSKIIVYMTKSNPDRIPKPLPPNACCLGGAIIFGGGSKNRSRKKDQKGNKKYMDQWSEV